MRAQQRYSYCLSEFLLFSFLRSCIKYECRLARKAFGHVCLQEGGTVGGIMWSHTAQVLQFSLPLMASRVSLIFCSCVQTVFIFFLWALARSLRQSFWAGISCRQQKIFQFLTVKCVSGKSMTKKTKKNKILLLFIYLLASLFRNFVPKQVRKLALDDVTKSTETSPSGSNKAANSFQWSSRKLKISHSGSEVTGIWTDV